jgi:AcrR family transcriptional regulator
MREIATSAELAAGASYYHFSSKDELVFAFYQQMEEEASSRCRANIESTSNFNERVKDAFNFKIEQLSKERFLILALARSAADPTNPLSPFSAPSKEIRDRVILMFENIVEGSDLKVSAKLKAELKNILWLLYLGIIFFWAHDPSSNQKLTKDLVGIILKLLKEILPLSRLPLTGTFQMAAIKLSQTVMGLVQEPK